MSDSESSESSFVDQRASRSGSIVDNDNDVHTSPRITQECEDVDESSKKRCVFFFSLKKIFFIQIHSCLSFIFVID